LNFDQAATRFYTVFKSGIKQQALSPEEQWNWRVRIGKFHRRNRQQQVAWRSQQITQVRHAL